MKCFSNFLDRFLYRYESIRNSAYIKRCSSYDFNCKIVVTKSAEIPAKKPLSVIT